MRLSTCLRAVTIVVITSTAALLSSCGGRDAATQEAATPEASTSSPSSTSSSTTSSTSTSAPTTTLIAAPVEPAQTSATSPPGPIECGPVDTEAGPVTILIDAGFVECAAAVDVLSQIVAFTPNSRAQGDYRTGWTVDEWRCWEKTADSGDITYLCETSNGARISTRW